MEYNRAPHSEIREAPVERFLRGPDVGRPSPTAEELRQAFRVEERRVQRRSDGTVTIAGVRYEVPSHFAWRIEDLVMHGGFALVTGDVGAGKSAALRLVASKLASLRDVIVGEVTRPQSRVTDFYTFRENSLFVGSLDAGERYANLLTILLNCELAGVKPLRLPRRRH